MTKKRVDIARDDVLPNIPTYQRRAFERLGFVFGKVLEDQPKYVQATLPDGWCVVPFAAPAYLYIRDPQGRERVLITRISEWFSYSYHVELLPRIRIVIDDKDYPDSMTCRVVYDDGRVLQECRELDLRSGPRSYGTCLSAMKFAARCWLREHLPRWSDPEAYWDVEDLSTLIDKD